jgi:predicted nucleic acid-binding protein
MRIVLDTSVLIDVLRSRNQRRELLVEMVRAGHGLATTTLNITELYAGMRPGEEVKTEAFLEGLECFELTGTAARLAGKLKSVWAQEGHTLTLADTIVAALTIERKCTLLTDNRKHFPMDEVQLYPLP